MPISGHYYKFRRIPGQLTFSRPSRPFPSQQEEIRECPGRSGTVGNYAKSFLVITSDMQALIWAEPDLAGTVVDLGNDAEFGYI